MFSLLFCVVSLLCWVFSVAVAVVAATVVAVVVDVVNVLAVVAVDAVAAVTLLLMRKGLTRVIAESQRKQKGKHRLELSTPVVRITNGSKGSTRRG